MKNRVTQQKAISYFPWFSSLRALVAIPTWFWLLPLALPALWPFYAEGLPRSFDGGLHLLRLNLLDYHLHHGVFYPRWTPELLLGYGYPLFTYYAPLAYYLTEGLHLAGLSQYQAFIGAFCLSVLGAGLGMYALARDIFGRNQPWATLVAATAYMFGPYLLTNIFIRGAIAEACAQALLPWIFWSVRGLWTAAEPRRFWLATVFSLGALALMHNITLLFLPPVLLGYCLLLWRATRYNSPHSVRQHFSGELYLYCGCFETRSFSAKLHRENSWFQTERSIGQGIGWLATAILAAMGISAFFWLPLLLERHYLADTAYSIAKGIWLPLSVWTWRNFLDLDFVFHHTFVRPIRLGAVQLGLALLGFGWAWRRDAEWIFWGAVALFSGLFMGAWALPLWQNNDILPVAQFAWRLLSILSLPLALFVGGLLLHLPARGQVVGGLGLLALVVLAQQPRLQWMDVFTEAGVNLSLPVFAQIELEKGAISGGESNSSVQEFRPRWTDRSLLLDPASVMPTPSVAVRVEQANAYDLKLTVEAVQASALRLGSFYFPGWEILLDGQTSLTPYPSTNLGLLTVDLPAGRHTLSVVWRGTPLQHGAVWLSLLTLVCLSGVCWSWRGLRSLAWLPTLLLLFGGVATFWPRPLLEVQQLAEPITVQGITLTSWRLENAEPGFLTVYPYWYVTKPPPATLRIRWQVRDGTGQVVTETASRPYYNTSSAQNWPSGALIDDAYRLPLRPELPAGRYQLYVALETDGAVADDNLKPIGEFTTLTPAPPLEPPPHSLDVQFVHGLRLAGYGVQMDRPLFKRAERASSERPPVAYAGQYVRYTLYWQASGLVTENYHAFVHLTDHAGTPLVQEDQQPGPLFYPPKLWDAYHLSPDVYLLRIPRTATSGLYWPQVGLYKFETLDRLPMFNTNQIGGNDHYQLPPIKILGTQATEPVQRLTARLGDIANLLGYTLVMPSTQIRAGDHFQAIIYYECLQETARDYTRFLQLYDPQRGMAAQQDGPPQEGNNPTWAWMPGEIIVDAVDLQVAANASAGYYQLYLGFYDPQENGARLPVVDAQGQTMPEAWMKLTTIEVK